LARLGLLDRVTFHLRDLVDGFPIVGLDALFLDENEEWIKHEWVSYIGPKKEDLPPANHDWKKYSGVVAIPENTKTIVIGLQIYGPGTVWFDDVSLKVLDDPQSPREMIQNGTLSLAHC
ncbi:MAG: hypothetical protein HGA82_00120, partial [Anaerolineales bacterium]|nr:hypothetical protein [Anaerolineales bacterium]